MSRITVFVGLLAFEAIAAAITLSGCVGVNYPLAVAGLFGQAAPILAIYSGFADWLVG